MSVFIPDLIAIAGLKHSPGVQLHVDEVAAKGADVAKGLVSVETGELQDSIGVEDGEDGGKRVVVGTDHWIYVEFGTAFVPARPFMRPILDQIDVHR